jgi:hypothetical protein
MPCSPIRTAVCASWSKLPARCGNSKMTSSATSACRSVGTRIFPTDPNSVHYVLAAVSMAASGNVDATISVTTTGTPVFVYNLQPDNTCVYPAHVRFLLQQKGDDLSGRNGKQYFRWWSNSVAYQLAPGQAQLRASLTDLSQWTSVLGEKANTSAAATAGFKEAITNLGSVGFSFGGGCFYGHGVRVSGGGARFAVTGYAIK